MESKAHNLKKRGYSMEGRCGDRIWGRRREGLARERGERGECMWERTCTGHCTRKTFPQSHQGEKVKGADYRKFLEAVEPRVWSLRTPCRPHEWILASSEVLLVEWR